MKPILNWTKSKAEAQSRHVCFGSTAEVMRLNRDVCFYLESGQLLGGIGLVLREIKDR
jgi:hypothetical protein